MDSRGHTYSLYYPWFEIQLQVDRLWSEISVRQIIESKDSSAKDSIKHAFCSAFMIEVYSKVKVKRDGKVSGSFDTSNYDKFVVIVHGKTYSKSPQEDWSNVTDSWYWKLRLTVPLFFKFVIKLLGTHQEQCQEIRGLRKFPHGFAAACVDYVCGSTGKGGGGGTVGISRWGVLLPWDPGTLRLYQS